MVCVVELVVVFWKPQVIPQIFLMLVCIYFNPTAYGAFVMEKPFFSKSSNCGVRFVDDISIYRLILWFLVNHRHTSNVLIHQVSPHDTDSNSILYACDFYLNQIKKYAISGNQSIYHFFRCLSGQTVFGSVSVVSWII